MAKQILIAHASQHGAAAEIAEKIGAVTRGAGPEADVLTIRQVGDLSAYRAAVLGSAVYMGSWRKEFVRFLKAHEEELAGLPVWLFSSGPTGEGDPLELVKGWRVPTVRRTLVDAIRPREIVVFHGRLEQKKLNFFQRWIIGRVGAKVSNFRDWKASAAWGAAIAGSPG